MLMLMTPSRDRINFSRAMLKRFIRDCVQREAAVYSPWTVKPAVAARYGIPTEMSDSIREQISTYREKQMDRRKREREERLGITNEETEEVKDEKPGKKRAKKESKEEIRLKLEQQQEEEEKKRRKPLKYPAEGEFWFPISQHHLRSKCKVVRSELTRCRLLGGVWRKGSERR